MRKFGLVMQIKVSIGRFSISMGKYTDFCFRKEAVLRLK